MENRWIKVFLSIENWVWFNTKNMLDFWIRVLLKANWKDECIDGETIKRGTFVTSISELAKDTGYKDNEVRKYLSRLEKTGEIECSTLRIPTRSAVRKGTSICTKITICNYDSYQSSLQESEQESKQEFDNNIVEERSILPPETPLFTKEDNIYRNIEESSFSPNEIVDLWNSIVTACAKVAKLSEPRRQKVYSRIKEMGGKEKAREIITLCFQKINNSSFCTGHNDRGWKADFDWFFTNGNNWVKVYEGKYDDKKEAVTRPEDNLFTTPADGGNDWKQDHHLYGYQDFMNNDPYEFSLLLPEMQDDLKAGKKMLMRNGLWEWPEDYPDYEIIK